MNKLNFGGIEVSKKVKCYESKKGVELFQLSSIDVNKIVVSNRVKGNNDPNKDFIGYLDDTDSIVRPLRLVPSQMSGWIKYFENGGKNMSFKIEDDEVYLKYNEI